ncbi:hypothetical protein [Novosphingobium sp.]|uniref:hypothetical protein n=1 Tax=Novosphingobium sp. TaxID=1874826 RepID=UPI003566FF50
MSMGQGGIFGNPRVRRGRMGSIEPDYTDMGSMFPGIGRVIPGMGDMQVMDGPQTQPKPKPKFFGQGGTGRAIAGTIGDALLQMSGMQPIYGPMMQDRQAIAAQEQAMMRKRAWELEDAARKGPELTSFQKNLLAANIDPNSEQGRNMSLMYAQQQGDPPVEVDVPQSDGSVRRVVMRYSQIMAGQSGQTGQRKPVTMDDWNAAKPLGGAAQTGQRTFP